MKQACDCKSIGDLREEIDRLDREIIKLIGERFQYVKRVPEFKDDTKESVIAQERYDQVMINRRKWADEEGLNADVIEDVYKKLVGYFIDEQLKIKKINK